MKIPENKLKSLRHIFYMKARENKDIRATATAFKYGGEGGTKLFELGDIKNLGNLNRLLALGDYTGVKIDMFDISNHDKKLEKTYVYTDETPVVSNLGNVSETDMEKQLQKMLNARLREMDYQRLQTENQQLKSHLTELENDLEDAEEANDQMREKLKSQQGLKTYAELAGIALDKMGLKDKVSDVLSGFLGNDENSDEETPTHLDDSSGIIEDFTVSNPQPQPQNDLIELINLCLLEMDKPTLAIAFAIFSKIEKNKNLALQILEMMYQNNSTISENTLQNLTNDLSDE